MAISARSLIWKKIDRSHFTTLSAHYTVRLVATMPIMTKFGKYFTFSKIRQIVIFGNIS